MDHPVESPPDLVPELYSNWTKTKSWLTSSLSGCSNWHFWYISYYFNCTLYTQNCLQISSLGACLANTKICTRFPHCHPEKKPKVHNG